MHEPIFNGCGVALVAPFGAGLLYEAELRELGRFHLRAGTDRQVVPRGTGEAAPMCSAEQGRALEAVEHEAGGRIPVIAGVGGSDTAEVVQLATSARAAGADALLLSAPPYNKPTQRGLTAHFRAVLEAVDLRMIVYNVPGRTACNILPETV